MAITIDGKIYRNLQEQVKYLTDRINEIKPYVAGAGITISGQTIAIDPSINDEIEALDIALGTKLSQSDIVQELGNSETAVMSQKATTDEIGALKETKANEPVTITVKSNGTGDFTNLRLAVESITDASLKKPYVIEVYPGTYNVADYFTQEEINAHNVGITLTEGMTLRGMGARNDIVIYGELDSSLYDQTTRNRFSTLNMKGTCSLENVTVGAKQIRYAVHDDFGVPFRKRIVKNCRFYGSQLTSGSPARAYGQGDAYGCMSYFENCDFDVEYFWHGHNSAATTKGSSVMLVNCKASAVRFHDYQPNDIVSNNIKLIGCDFGTIYVDDLNGKTIRLILSGHGNTYGSISAPDGFTHALEQSLLTLDTLPIYDGGVV